MRDERCLAIANAQRRQKKVRDTDELCHEFVKHFYERKNLPKARAIAKELKASLEASPEESESIRGDEMRSLLAELRGDFVQAARCREAEVRKIFTLHALSEYTPHCKTVAQLYNYSDLSDRLDILAILYDELGDRDRAVDTLRESKLYCQARKIPFDGQELLNELTQDIRTDAYGSANGHWVRKSKA